MALCVICSLELLSFFAVRNAAAIYRPGQEFAVPSGYLLDGGYLGETQVPCYLIRITADACPYCRQDREHYERLAQEAAGRGCRVIELAPRVGQVASREDQGPIQLQYVNMKLGQALNPFVTPQTIVLDSEARLRWQRQGAMDQTDLERGVHALRN